MNYLVAWFFWVVKIRRKSSLSFRKLTLMSSTMDFILFAVSITDSKFEMFSSTSLRTSSIIFVVHILFYLLLSHFMDHRYYKILLILFKFNSQHFLKYLLKSSRFISSNEIISQSCPACPGTIKSCLVNIYFLSIV